MKSLNTMLVRRIVAVVLMLLTILFLFWPAYVTLEGILKTGFSAWRSYITNMYTHFRSGSEELTFFTNVAFFGLLCLAIIAAISMAFNNTGMYTVLHTAFSIIFLCITLFALKKLNSVITVGYGVSMFLIPAFSLASSIIYKEGGEQQSKTHVINRSKYKNTKWLSDN